MIEELVCNNISKVNLVSKVKIVMFKYFIIKVGEIFVFFFVQ